jgi:hypothetical protein
MAANLIDNNKRKRTIQISQPERVRLGITVEGAKLPLFPAWGARFEKPLGNTSEVVEDWMRERPDDRWLLLAWSAAASERHLWSVWLSMVNKMHNQTEIARSQDAEFMRILSGTHQIRVAFERAGIQSGDEYVWLIHLPDGSELKPAKIPLDSIPAILPTINFDTDEIEAARLMTWIGADLEPGRPVPSLAGLERIGAASSELTKPNKIQISDLELMFISHAAGTDIAV